MAGCKFPPLGKVGSSSEFRRFYYQMRKEYMEKSEELERTVGEVEQLRMIVEELETEIIDATRVNRNYVRIIKDLIRRGKDEKAQCQAESDGQADAGQEGESGKTAQAEESGEENQ